MNKKAFLDGEIVDIVTIDPKKHKFIGTFRFPNPPNGKYIDSNGVAQQAAVIFCSCGASLWTQDKGLEHWQLGHFDIPQYTNL